MIKKIVAASSAVIMTALFSVTALAENGGFLQYTCDEREITVYAEGISDDVSCRIAGVECESEIVGNVYSDEEKFKTLFLIDTSASMGGFSDKISGFLLECIDKKKDNEFFAIAEFGATKAPNYLSDFDNKQYPLEKVVSGIKYDDESSYIFDNMKSAVSALSSDGEDCFKRIVLFTDGCENSAYGITIEDVLSQLSDTPLQVYTVTFLNSDKTNFDKLKNATRLSSNTNAADIRINADTDAAAAAHKLISDVQNITRIKVTADAALCDGGVKAIEIVSGGTSVSYDIRMAMLTASSETVQETETEITSVTSAVTEAVPEPEEKSFPFNFVIAVCGAAAVISVIVLIINVRGNKKTQTEEIQYSGSAADNDDTMIISSGGGDTAMLFDDNNSASVITLRDAANSAHTFEVSLSGDIIIGRSSDSCSLVIDYDKSVSKRHCRIFKRGRDVMIEDLGSSNKTYVNDIEVLSPMQVHTADEIKIGRVRFKIAIH